MNEMMQLNPGKPWLRMRLWNPDDIPWHRFDRSRVDPDVVKLVKAASMVEYNAPVYAGYLCGVFHNNPTLQALARAWAEEEVQHGRTLARWAALADPDFDFEARFKVFTGGFQVPTGLSESVRGSLTGELLARCVVETGTSSHYTAIRRSTGEPVLQELCRRLAADELRHYKTFYELSRQYRNLEGVGLPNRLKVVVGRVLETEDQELAYAYYAANRATERFDHKHFTQQYVRSAYPLYPPYLVERIVAMLFKIVGLEPHGRFSRFLARVSHRFMRRRARRIAVAAA